MVRTSDCGSGDLGSIPSSGTFLLIKFEKILLYKNINKDFIIIDKKFDKLK